MSMKKKRKWYLWAAFGVIIPIILISVLWFILIMLAFPEETLAEKQLKNGDWIKIRHEPDFQHDYVHLYSKTTQDSEYRHITFWKGKSAAGVEIHLDAPTPVIFTPDTMKILVRLPDFGWHRISTADIVNANLPAEFPQIQDYRAAMIDPESFNGKTNEFTVKGY